MKIFSHLIDGISLDNCPTYVEQYWRGDKKAWATGTICAMYNHEAEEEYNKLSVGWGYNGIYDSRFKTFTPCQFDKVQQLINSYHKKAIVRFEKWLAEPGLHIFITVPRQKTKFEAFLKKYNLEDKVVFQSKPLWNLSYCDDSHTLQLFIVEQK